MEEIKFSLNGKEITAAVDPKMSLLRYLRDELGMVGAKDGCSRSQCGACMVIVNQKAVTACSVKLGKLQGAQVETIEGLAQGGQLHPLQTSFMKLSAFQCGFCTPGMIMAAKALLDSNPDPTPDEVRFALRRNICRCTGYKKIVEAVLLAADIINGRCKIDIDEYSGVVGDRAVRTDALRKVTGKPVYTDDYKLVKPLQGKMLFSKYPHAKVLAVDVSQARKQPGVAYIATYDDVPGRKDFGQGMFPQQPVIAGNVVRFVGDPVAVVYAETEEQAYAAMEHIHVEYEPLPVLTTPEEAMAEGACKIYEEGNLLKHIHTHKGSVERAFATADFIVEDTYSVGAIDHAYMEPDAALAEYDENGLLTVYGSVQNPMGLRRDLAACLAMDESKLRVVTRPNGGAFGGREEPSVHIQAALGTLLTGRPVRMVFTREELNIFSTKRHAMKMHYKLGATKDGTITAIQANTVGDTGAYASSGEFVLFRACVFGAGPYAIPNACMDSYAVYTNNVTAASMRGFGSTQPCVAMESMVDRLAEKCGLDPFEIRRRNGLDIGKQTITGHVIDYSVGFKEALDKVEAALRKDGLPEPSGPHKKIGVGIAGSMKNVGLGSGCEDAAWAQMRLGQDGMIELLAGAVECGQGHDTVAVQIAAQTLGVSMNRIRILPIDSTVSMDGGITTASRQTFVSGNAVKTVSAMFRGSMLRMAARISGIEEGYLECGEDGIFDVREGHAPILSYGQLAEQTEKLHEKLYEKYYYIAPQTSPIHECSDNPSNDMVGHRLHFSYCFGVQAVIVEVDEDTGEVRVLRVYAANDVGRAINPALVEGQIEGGVAMGIGYALSEKFEMKDGYVLTKQIKDMGIPHTMDVPLDIRPILVEEIHPYGPYGAKGMGELPLNATAPAIMNAIYQATGVRVTELPITPQKLKALLKQRG